MRFEALAGSGLDPRSRMVASTYVVGIAVYPYLVGHEKKFPLSPVDRWSIIAVIRFYWSSADRGSLLI